jgi:hypothetical protein
MAKKENKGFDPRPYMELATAEMHKSKNETRPDGKLLEGGGGRVSQEVKSLELKAFVSKFDSAWFVGYVGDMMMHIHTDLYVIELRGLVSPQRQLYYIAALNLTSEPSSNEKAITPEEWEHCKHILNEIDKLIDLELEKGASEFSEEEWERIKEVAVPSFVKFYNEGPLNFEEQMISWVEDLFLPMNDRIENELGISVHDLLRFYENLDFQMAKNYTLMNRGDLENWEELTVVKVEHLFPVEMMPSKVLSNIYHRKDPGLTHRFKAGDLVDKVLNLGKVDSILALLSTERKKDDFTFYSASNPFDHYPILRLDNNFYQVFEVKQVIHSISEQLKRICKSDQKGEDKFNKTKGSALESKTLMLCKKFFGNDARYFESYYVDGNEQDILILWKGFAFIIEIKAYEAKEPRRDPPRAAKQMKQAFKRSVGAAAIQAKRIADYFVDEEDIVITDHKGNVIETIETADLTEYSILVTQEAFGQIQCDLSTLLELEDKEYFNYPWAVRFDDLEVFILSLIKLNKGPAYFESFLEFREKLHGRLNCTDELQVCGAFIQQIIPKELIKSKDLISTNPSFAHIFDEYYRNVLGFENEKYVKEKQRGLYM